MCNLTFITFDSQEEAKAGSEPASLSSSAGLEKREALLELPGIKFSNISGVINTVDCDRFKKLIFRITRGIIFIRYAYYFRKCYCNIR